MSIELPNEVSRRLSEFEAAGATLNAIELAGQLHTAAGPDEALTEEQRRGCLAEIASLRFIVARGTDTEPWGIYFQPLGTFFDNAGVPRYGPDARWMDAEIIEYWKTRAASCPHAALRARYADLAREIGDLWNRDHPQAKVDKPRTLSQLAANSYIDAVEAGLAKDAYVSWQWLERALTVAATIKDPQLIGRAKKAALEFQRARDKAGESGLWWRLDDVMAGSKGVAWTDAEKAEVCDLLRKRLALASDIAGKEFDPHAATGAADRLARWVDSAEKISALRTAGGAFEAMAAKADALVATAWLEDLSRRYRDAKLDADANRVDGVIRGRADEVVASMKKTSTSIEIPPEEIGAWLDEIVQGPLPHGLARIAVALLNDPKKIEDQIKTMASVASASRVEASSPVPDATHRCQPGAAAMNENDVFASVAADSSAWYLVKQAQSIRGERDAFIKQGRLDSWYKQFGAEVKKYPRTNLVAFMIGVRIDPYQMSTKQFPLCIDTIESCDERALSNALAAHAGVFPPPAADQHHWIRRTGSYALYVNVRNNRTVFSLGPDQDRDLEAYLARTGRHAIAFGIARIDNVEENGPHGRHVINATLEGIVLKSNEFTPGETPDYYWMGPAKLDLHL